jgi:hypothetical protein
MFALPIVPVLNVIGSDRVKLRCGNWVDFHCVTNVDLPCDDVSEPGGQLPLVEPRSEVHGQEENALPDSGLLQNNYNNQNNRAIKTASN